jgi:CspA family cold shock protein
MKTGSIKFFNATKGYGFIIQDDGGSEAFFHAAVVKNVDENVLYPGTPVSYSLQPDNARIRANSVVVLNRLDFIPLPEECSHRAAVVNSTTQDVRVFRTHTEAREFVLLNSRGL